ncbi:MAG: 3-hydroxybutyryl-CoA dehydrogenase [Anaerolineales bacterium]|nr:3-hydroxybutyryl-CoA dehydrogenase [Anaerolineales bacterium]
MTSTSTPPLENNIAIGPDGDIGPNVIIGPDVTIGIIGAGTMGSGIALVALFAGHRVILHDVVPVMLEQAKTYLEKFLTRKGQGDRMAKVQFTADIEDFAPATVIIEAALEDLPLKQDLFARLERICVPETLLTTNTSTLPVTAIASAVSTPARVAGFHFFNPAPILPLVEVVRGALTSQATLDFLVALATQMGKTPVVTRDTPGFIVNRVARPFYGEALRLLGENVATHAQIDWAVQLGGGFRMGPFRLMDLIGIDINAAAMKSMYEQTFGEPRYRPHWIQAQMTQAKRFGRKSGQGFYDYRTEGEESIPTPPEVGDNAGTLILSEGSYAPGLAALCEQAGYALVHHPVPEMSPLAGLVFNGKNEGLKDAVIQMDATLPPDVPLLCQCADAPLTEIATWMDYPETLVGFDGLFFCNGTLVTLVSTPFLTDAIRQAAENFVRSLGRIPLWIEDSPGLILPRILSMLINEAAFAVLEGVADADTVDLAMRLGVNYPRGLVEWGQEIGFGRVVAVLNHLQAEYGEDRYRACSLLRRWARNENLKNALK